MVKKFKSLFNLNTYKNITVTQDELNRMKNKFPKTSYKYRILKYVFDKQNFQKGYARGVYYPFLLKCICGCAKTYGLAI